MKTIVAGASGVVVVILVAVLIITTGLRVNAVDIGWSEWMAQLHYGPGVVVAHALATIGGTWVVTLISAAIVVLMLVLRRWRAALAVTLAVAGGSLCATLLKWVVERPRPRMALMHLTSTSFPSGHSTIAAALAVTLALALPRVWSWVAASIWMVAMAVSRTYLEVHWLSDVLAGLLLGASVALIVDGATRMVIRRHAED